MQTSQLLPTRLACIGKRSRSNSSSSTSSNSSSSTASSAGASIFSQVTSTNSADNLSPATSGDDSPNTINQIDERPCKTLRTERSSSTDVALGSLEEKCSLGVHGSDSRQSSAEPEKQASSSGGKTVFVDCLVDATIHVLDVIWEAPIERSIAFVCDEASSSASTQVEHKAIDRKCICPAGTPVTGGIPLPLFIRETLRRSRTSCSTLQAALLFCKRAGGEVIRQRAKAEGFTLTEEQLAKLPGASDTYASLQSVSTSSTNDHILCARRIFLASVMISSKFLQDRTFSNRAWSKISGLNVRELSVVERRLLNALDFDLNVREQKWNEWTQYLKGEWRLRTASTNVPNGLGRKLLERTNSLQEAEEVFDLDVASSNRATMSFTFTSPLSPSTPTPIMPTSDPSTPIAFASTLGTESRKTATSTPTRKEGASLLSTAVHNHMLASDDSSDLKSSMPLPYPLRKGLSLRSISSF